MDSVGSPTPTPGTSQQIEVPDAATCPSQPPMNAPPAAQEAVQGSEGCTEAAPAPEASAQDGEPPQTGSLAHSSEAATTSEAEPAEEQPSPTDTQQYQELVQEANNIREQGNELFRKCLYDEAIQKYTHAAAIAPPEAHTERGLCFTNLALCYLTTKQYQEAVNVCCSALEETPGWEKALRRRCMAYELLSQYDKALDDAKALVDQNASDEWAVSKVKELEPKVKEQQEKLKAEMLGKLKDLGNTLLGKFGMSLNNFQTQKDPETGGYSIKFNPNP